MYITPIKYQVMRKLFVRMIVRIAQIDQVVNVIRIECWSNFNPNEAKVVRARLSANGCLLRRCADLRHRAAMNLRLYPFSIFGNGCKIIDSYGDVIRVRSFAFAFIPKNKWSVIRSSGLKNDGVAEPRCFEGSLQVPASSNCQLI